MALNYTATDRGVPAVGGSEESAELVGLPADRIRTLAHVASGGLGGLAGVLLAASSTPASLSRARRGIIAIASVVIGSILLTGDVSSISATLAGMLSALMFFAINYSLSTLSKLLEPRYSNIWEWAV